MVLSPHFVAGENVEDPAQILLGLTAMGAGTAAMQADWRDGTLAEFALAPAAIVTPAEGLDTVAAAQLAVLNRAIVPYGGLLRGRLAAGETLIINGATGAYGTVAVLVGLALGACGRPQCGDARCPGERGRAESGVGAAQWRSRA